MTPVVAQETGLNGLYQELFEADENNHARIADRISGAWERSGSPAMDLLLRRGVEAMEDDDPMAAVEHLTALVDHAPDFAEGYHTRASAYYALGLMGPAIDDLRQVLVLNPRHFDAMFGVGVIMEELDQLEEAREVYEAILGIYPLDPEALGGLERLDLAIGGQSL
jgi:tetratricopeptide (TPR) repeat protein